MFESIFVCYVVVRVLWYVLCFTYNKKKKKKYAKIYVNWRHLVFQCVLSTPKVSKYQYSHCLMVESYEK